MALSKKNYEHAQRPVPCDACENEEPGTYYCIQCKKTLCDECKKLHRKFTNGHDVVLRSQIGDIGQMTLSCTEHEGHASFYCEKCNAPVCQECVTGDHQGHKLINVSDVVEQKKSLLQQDISIMQKEILPKLVNQKEHIQTERERYESEVNEITRKMETEHQDARKELDRIHNERLRNLSSTVQSNLMIFDDCATEINCRVESCKEKISKYDDVYKETVSSLLINFVERREPLPKIKILPNLPKAPMFASGKIMMIGECLGKLQLKSLKITTPMIVSKFNSPLKGLPSICVSKKGEVWLGGEDTRKLVMVDSMGKIMKKRRTKNRPIALAAMDCGDIIVASRSEDSNSLGVLRNDDREKQVLDISPSSCYGVSVTSDQKVLICTRDGKVVRTTVDGTKVEQIYQGSGELTSIHAVEDNNGSVFITDFANSELIIVNKEDEIPLQREHSVERKTMGKPTGLVVDIMGNILCSDQGHQCIYIIEKNQRLRKLIDSSHGIDYPRWLAVDNDNNLWITQRSGNVVIVKYLDL